MWLAVGGLTLTLQEVHVLYSAPEGWATLTQMATMLCAAGLLSALVLLTLSSFSSSWMRQSWQSSSWQERYREILFTQGHGIDCHACGNRYAVSCCILCHAVLCHAVLCCARSSSPPARQVTPPSRRSLC